MSLLLERKGTHAPLPRLDGKEVLVGPDPSIAKVKGVMFGGRKQFLIDAIGDEGFYAVLARLSPRTMTYARTPLASAWCEFESLMELDRTIYDTMKAKFPNVLALIGAASAELGIGRVYKSLDSAELMKFFENNALFHGQYQKFGTVRFEATTNGARMIYTDYPCYSPIYCASAFGYFLESILRHGGTDPNVTETKCQTLGDSSCTFEMTWR
jgi:predicted hydrocarbon binding protein